VVVSSGNVGGYALITALALLLLAPTGAVVAGYRARGNARAGTVPPPRWDEAGDDGSLTGPTLDATDAAAETDTPRVLSVSLEARTGSEVAAMPLALNGGGQRRSTRRYAAHLRMAGCEDATSEPTTTGHGP
jgi:hypothetical protein